MIDEADYVIVGAGSAGCVLANRLRRGGNGRSSNIGGTDRSIFIQMPAALSIPMAWPATTGAMSPSPSPTSAAAGSPARAARCWAARRRSTAWSMSAAIPPTSTAGGGRAPGWSYADVLPYFSRAETRADGGDAWRGDDGPLAHPLGRAPQPALPRLRRGRRRGRLPRVPRRQRLPAGRLRPHGQTVAAGAGRRRTPISTRRWAGPICDRQTLPSYPHPLRRRRATGVEYRDGGAVRSSRRPARGHRRRRRDHLAAAPEALRHRTRRGSRDLGIPVVPTAPASARTCRTISNSTSRSRARSRSPSIRPTTPAKALIGCAGCLPGRPRRHQPFRGRRLHPLAPGVESRPPVPLPAARGLL